MCPPNFTRDALFCDLGTRLDSQSNLREPLLRTNRKLRTSLRCQWQSCAPPSVARCAQRMHAEQAVGPGLNRRPAAAEGQRSEGVDGIFVTVLGVDGLAGTELDCFVADTHLLPPGAGEVHLNPMTFAVVEGVMLKGGEIEIGPQLAIDARQQIEVEFRSDALGIVVGAVENVGQLFKIDA